jgi:hypothetical protein
MLSYAKYQKAKSPPTLVCQRLSLPLLEQLVAHYDEIPLHQKSLVIESSVLMGKFRMLLAYYIVVRLADRNLMDIRSIGGFKGEPQDAPSGINQKEKLRLLKSEGVLFENGVLVDKERWWDGFKV